MNNVYQQRINSAVEFIESNLHQPLSLEQVAEHSYFSPFHFHRIFRGAMNETLNNFIMRRRLEMAANRLIVKREESVTDIAYLCGFSSSANFAKAFKKYFGFSASDVRQPNRNNSGSLGAIVKKYGKSFTPSAMYPQRDTAGAKSSLNVTMTFRPKVQLCALMSQGGYQPEALFSTWEQLINWGEQQGIPLVNQQRLAVCFDNPAITPIDKCRYQAALVIDDKHPIQAPFFKAELPAGDYGIIYVKGSPEQVEEAQKQLFSEWLPNSHYEPDNLPMIEHYLNDVRVDGYLEMNLILKLKKCRA